VYSYLNLSTEHADLYSFTILFTLGSLTLLTDLQGLFAGMKDYSTTGVVLALPSLARVSLIALLALTHIATLQTAILAYALSSVIPFFVFMLIPRYRGVFREVREIKLPSWQMMAFGASLVIVTSVPILGQSLAKVAISHKIGVLWQGYFDVSLTLTSLLIFSIGTLGLISLPESTTGDIKSIGKKGGLVDVSRLLLSFTVLAGILLSIYSRDIVVFLFSSDFITAAAYVPVLVIAYIALFFLLFLVNINLATAHTTREFLVPTVISLVILPLFFFSAEWLIDVFKEAGMGNGLVGAYISYTLLVVILTVTLILFTHDRSPLRYLSDGIWRLLIPALAITGLLLSLRPGPVAGILLACGLFTLLVFSFRYVDISLFLEILHDSRSQG